MWVSLCVCIARYRHNGKLYPAWGEVALLSHNDDRRRAVCLDDDDDDDDEEEEEDKAAEGNDDVDGDINAFPMHALISA